jgi:hypothetical protein
VTEHFSISHGGTHREHQEPQRSYSVRVLTNAQEAIRSIILNPQNAEYLALIKAARNGMVYGAKVRFPHALV